MPTPPIQQKNSQQHNRNGNVRRAQYLKSLHVPRSNIINLKELQAKREADAAVTVKPTLRERWGTAKIFDFLSKLTSRRTAHEAIRVTTEKVIVSSETNTPKVVAIPEAIVPPPPAPAKPEKPSSIQTTEDPALVDHIAWNQFQLDRFSWKRLIVFASFCLLLVVPVSIAALFSRASTAKGTVLGISSEAISELQRGGSLASQSDFTQAESAFSTAADNFNKARDEVTAIGGIATTLTKLIPGKAQSAQYLLEAGSALSHAGTLLAETADRITVAAGQQPDEQNTSFGSYLGAVQQNLPAISTDIRQAAASFNKVRTKDMPVEYQPLIEQAKEVLPKLKQGLQQFDKLSGVLTEVIGGTSPKRYLIIFQNSRELRPTGGFIGSIALVDITKGIIKKIEVPGGGVYDLAGQLKEKLIAPKPLWLVNPHWNIQDSNWFPDFPASAKKLEWFYERTGGTSVDGVISLTPAIVERLLAVTGPIDMQAQYGVTVDQNNFVSEAQYWAEVAYDRAENKPKKFISDLMPLLLERVFQIQSENILNIMTVFGESLQQKDLLMYFNNEEAQSAITQLGWDGSLVTTDGDYLDVISTNIGGGKTDHVVDQFIQHEAKIRSDGTIIDTVTVTRSHQGNPLDRWESVANVSYLRFYVPQGSRIVSASGFSEIPSTRFKEPDTDAKPDEDLTRIETKAITDEATGLRITDEFGKTAFGGWLSVDPGAVGHVTITYELPFTLQVGGLFGRTDSYSLYVQRQPGMANDFLDSTVQLPSGYQAQWETPGVKSIDERTYQYIVDLTADKYLGLLLK